MGGDGKGLITPKDAANLLSVSPRTIKKWLREGKIKGIKVFGSGWRIKKEEITKIIEQTKEESSS